MQIFFVLELPAFIEIHSLLPPNLILNERFGCDRSYCKKHSKNCKDNGSDSEKDEETKRNMRQRRIMELEEEFYTLVKDEVNTFSLRESGSVVFNVSFVSPPHKPLTLPSPPHHKLQKKIIQKSQGPNFLQNNAFIWTTNQPHRTFPETACFGILQHCRMF